MYQKGTIKMKGEGEMRLVGEMRERRDKKERVLTKRELEVLKLIIKGRKNEEIGYELNISPHTAKVYVSCVMDKLNVRNRIQAAVKGIREGMVELDY